MNKREDYKRIVMFGSSVAMVALFTAMFAMVWYLGYADNQTIIEIPFWRRGNYVVIGLYAVILTLFYKLFGGFSVDYLRIYEVLYTQIASVLCANVVTYMQLCLIGHWRFLNHVEPLLHMTGGEVLLICIYAVLLRSVYRKLNAPSNMVLVYGKFNPWGLVEKLQSREDKYALREMISCTEDMELIKEKIMHHGGVLLADVPDETRNALVKYCFANDVNCYLVPKLSDVMIKSSRDIHMFDTTLMLISNSRMTVEQRFIKRAMDIVVSLVGLLVASPVMLVIALGVKLCDGGPVFFTQQRLTKDGRLFKIYKFRSMRVDKEDSEYCMTRRDDDRVTPVGKVIRNLHFDELPQLFNVLIGDMSIVGPRPECPAVVEEYLEIIPEFNFRLKVKAGLTGFAQVYGKYNTTPYDKLNMDLNYIANYSLRLDVKLMWLTFRILFQKEKSEGIENWQTTAAAGDNPQEAVEEAQEMSGIK